MRRELSSRGVAMEISIVHANGGRSAIIDCPDYNFLASRRQLQILSLVNSTGRRNIVDIGPKLDLKPRTIYVQMDKLREKYKSRTGRRLSTRELRAEAEQLGLLDNVTLDIIDRAIKDDKISQKHKHLHLVREDKTASGIPIKITVFKDDVASKSTEITCPETNFTATFKQLQILANLKPASKGVRMYVSKKLNMSHGKIQYQLELLKSATGKKLGENLTTRDLWTIADSLGLLKKETLEKISAIMKL